MNGWLPLPRRAADDDPAAHRLAAFMRAHPEVNVLRPSSDRDRWRAEISPGTVPGDDREMIVTEYRLGAFTDKLEQLFRPDG